MRIIAGEKKSLILRSPRGRSSRPTADRVKESMFAIIGNMQGARILDLFAGSGSLAIEALSRGAQEAVLVDNSPQAIACIKENLQHTDLSDKARVMAMPVTRALRVLQREGNDFDLILMDPPYNKNIVTPTLQALSDGSLVRLNALVVVEHTSKEEVGPGIANLTCVRQELYGDTMITFMRRNDSVK